MAWLTALTLIITSTVAAVLIARGGSRQPATDTDVPHDAPHPRLPPPRGYRPPVARLSERDAAVVAGLRPTPFERIRGVFVLTLVALAVGLILAVGLVAAVGWVVTRSGS